MSVSFRSVGFGYFSNMASRRLRLQKERQRSEGKGQERKVVERVGERGR